MDNNLLRQVQLTQLEIMIEIDRICRKYNLKYYLFYGTLIGAVRHGGFIPWDDDLDIVMPRDDYEKLLQILKAELDEKYWLQCYDTDPNCWFPFAKIRKLGTVYREANQSHIEDSKCGIWVDIFPLDGATKNKGLLLSVRKFVVKTIGFSLRKRELNYGIMSFSRRYVPILLFWQLFSKKQLKFIQDFFMKKLFSKKCQNYVSLLSPYAVTKEVYPIEWFNKETGISFENGHFSVPEKYKECLEQLYGDYMTPPPIEKRGGHNLEKNSQIII